MTDPSVTALERRFVREARPLLAKESAGVVAVSGGIDSVALLHLLVRSGLWSQEGIATRLRVAHFDHGLRDESVEEARFVAKMAGQLGLTCVVERWNKPPDVGNLAAAARLARYRFLARIARRYGASHLIIGHHRDDQVETFLDRLLRGSGPSGLGAMEAVRPLEDHLTLVRPLLALSRRELQHWLTVQEIPWREDPSNQDVRKRRPWLRHRLLPELLTQEPHAAERIAATARRMRQTQQALSWTLDHFWPTLDPQEIEQHGLSLDLGALVRLPDALMIEALRRSYHQLTRSIHPPGERALLGVIQLARSQRSTTEMRIQGMKIRREEGRIQLIPTQDAPHPTGRRRKKLNFH